MICIGDKRCACGEGPCQSAREARGEVPRTSIPLNRAAAKQDGMTEAEWKAHEATIPDWIKEALK